MDKTKKKKKQKKTGLQLPYRKVEKYRSHSIKQKKHGKSTNQLFLNLSETYSDGATKEPEI